MPADWAAFYRTPLILRPDIEDFRAYLELEEERKKKRKAKEDEAKKFVPTFSPTRTYHYFIAWGVLTQC